MATLVLQAAGSLVGSLFGPWGTAIGSALGAAAGNAIDQQLLAPAQHRQGPQLDATPAMSAEEGKQIPRVYGTARVSTTIIWATRFEETATRERVGGKGIGGKSTNTTYTYATNFAVALCEGPINSIRRVWADGRELDLSDLQWRLHRGTETQAVDELIERKQGTGNAPAYRGTAYLVFEDFQLERFGNRIPQIEVEVIRSVGALENNLKAISIIPGSTEHGLDPRPVRKTEDGETIDVNRHVTFGDTDWNASIDELFAVAPNIEHASLVVSWFGDDLRAGECTVRPGVTERLSSNESTPWSVSGRDRSSQDVRLVSRHAGRAAYGGTPNDASVVRAIEDLKARGVRVTLNPFLLMDVPGDNDLPDPCSESIGQAAYPWRGRITCFPAPGQINTGDQSAGVTEQIDQFVGTAGANQFDVSETTVDASSDIEWSYRTFILHYAHLAASVGGIDTFIIGSELRGLTQIRDDAGQFPFVAHLIQLADDVRAILGASTNIVYAADWSEYFGYQPNDGSGDVFFHLDPLWASPNIDAVGIDMYAPLSDWRDEDDKRHANPDSFRHHADLAGFKTQIEGGEGFDWYYANPDDRAARYRTSITDGAHEKPWVFRYKDIRSWWDNEHFERRGGVELSTPTEWVPRSKKIWLMEVGCSALRGGARQPNLFPDAKSSENARPDGVSGALSDAEQRALINAYLEYWTDQQTVSSDHCPVDPERIYAWAWDARPYPSFPISNTVWGDGENWHSGHWLNGRLGTAPMTETIRQMMTDYGVGTAHVADIPDCVDGLVIASPEDARPAIEPLLSFFDLGIRDDTGDGSAVYIQPNSSGTVVNVDTSELVLRENAPVVEHKRKQLSELPSSATLSFRDPQYSYQRITKSVALTENTGPFPISVASPGVVRKPIAEQLAHAWCSRLHDRSSQIEFGLPLKWLGLQVGDVVVFDDDRRWLVETIDVAEYLTVSASLLSNASPFAPSVISSAQPDQHLSGRFGSIPDYELLDLPPIEGLDDQKSAMIAARSKSSRQVAVYASTTGENFSIRELGSGKATMGALSAEFLTGATAVWDQSNELILDLLVGELSSASDQSILAGANLAAIEKAGGWEVISFADAHEVEPRVWKLTRLLRGLGGTEDLTHQPAVPGAKFVLLNAEVRPFGLDISEMGRAINLRVGEAGRPFTERYFGDTSAIFGQRSRTPIAPVHLHAIRLDGDLRLKWIRRTRRGGDDWDAIEVPLAEDFERYKVSIKEEGNAASFDVDVDNQSSIDISAVDLTSAGINPNNALSISVGQISRAVGVGRTTSLVLPAA